MTPLRTGDKVPGYFVHVCCPRCQGTLTHCASGTPGLDTRAVAYCEDCERHWGVVAEMVDVSAEIGAKPRARDHAAEYAAKQARKALPDRLCELDTCQARFTPARKDQRYHSDRCRLTAAQRAYKARQAAADDGEAA